MFGSGYGVWLYALVEQVLSKILHNLIPAPMMD